MRCRRVERSGDTVAPCALAALAGVWLWLRLRFVPDIHNRRFEALGHQTWGGSLGMALRWSAGEGSRSPCGQAGNAYAAQDLSFLYSVPDGDLYHSGVNDWSVLGGRRSVQSVQSVRRRASTGRPYSAAAAYSAHSRPCGSPGVLEWT